jgi:hypothetical protein
MFLGSSLSEPLEDSMTLDSPLCQLGVQLSWIYQVHYHRKLLCFVASDCSVIISYSFILSLKKKKKEKIT